MWHRPDHAAGEFDDDFMEQFRDMSKRKKELEFLELATDGDIDRVSTILRDFPDLDKDCVDQKGRTALRMAIRRQQTPVVETLLDVSSGENVYNALLLSIDQDNDDVSELIINHATYRNYGKEKERQVEKEDETLFSQDVTPLMLAAQKEQNYIVQLLLELDERIVEPHKYDCPCDECKAIDTVESLKTARARLNAYRGLCSRAYILQTSKDPILRTFQLTDKTKWLSAQEKHFKKEYSQLSEQLAEMVTKLMDRIRTEEELEELLHAVSGGQADDSETEDGAPSKEFARLNLALYREQKTFVSHPYCQRKLMSLWYGDQMLQQKGQSLPMTILKSFYLMLLYPVLAVIYWLFPSSRLGVQISAPIIKFSATVFSYLIFVCMIVAHTVIKTPTAGVTLSEHPSIGPHYREYAGISSATFGRLRNFQPDFHIRKLQSLDDAFVENTTDIVYNTHADMTTVVTPSQHNLTTTPPQETTAQDVSKTQQLADIMATFQQQNSNNTNDTDTVADIVIRYHTVDALSVVICIWVIGYLVHDMKEVYSEPLGYYLASYFNIMDICLLLFYITSFTLRFVTIGKVHSAVSYLSTSESWQSVRMDDEDALQHLYWVNADRFYWDTTDPYVFCEALYAVANILIICRLAGLLIVNEAMGPLIISLGRMIDDIVRFLILFGLIFFAYIIGFLNLYWYYFPDTRSEAELTDHNLQVNAGDAFGDIELTLSTVFWSIFGMSDADAVEIDEAYAVHQVTNRFGYILFAIYNALSVIVFINILIAMMASSFDHVLESQDVEWKFARANLYIDFLREGNVLPVPLNLIPTPRSVYRFFRYTLCGKCCGPKSESKANETPGPDSIEMSGESSQGAAKNVYETPPNSESGISSELGEGTSSQRSSHGSLENPKMSDIQTEEQTELAKEEEEEQVNVYSSPVDDDELWRVRGQLKPEPQPSTAYSAVMAKLVHRYFNLGQSTDEAGNEQDSSSASAERLKNELDSLRNELRMTTFRLKKDLNILRTDTKSHLTKVEQQCDDVSKQCSDVSQQCTDVANQCEDINRALQRLFAELGNLSKNVEEVKAIASKPVVLPQFSSSKKSSSKPKTPPPEKQYVQTVETVSHTPDGKVEKTTTKLVSSSLPEFLSQMDGAPDVKMLSSEPDMKMLSSEPDVKMLSSEPDVKMLSSEPDVKMLSSEPDVKILSSQQTPDQATSSLKDKLPKALSSLFSRIDKPKSAQEDNMPKADSEPPAMLQKLKFDVPDQSDEAPTLMVNAKAPTTETASLEVDEETKEEIPLDQSENAPMVEMAVTPATDETFTSDLIPTPMMEYTIDPPMQQFSQLEEPSSHLESDLSLSDHQEDSEQESETSDMESPEVSIQDLFLQFNSYY